MHAGSILSFLHHKWSFQLPVDYSSCTAALASSKCTYSGLYSQSQSRFFCVAQKGVMNNYLL